MIQASRILLWVVLAILLQSAVTILSPYQRVSANDFFSPELLQDFEAIVGGEPTNIRDAPYAVAIFRSFSNGNVSYQCSASLVSESYVLTAAHCVLDAISGRQIRAADLSVRVGTAVLASGFGETVAVEESTPHPGFDFKDSTNDIALLKLAEAVEIEPIALPDQSPGADLFPGTGDNATVSGWGETLPDGGSNVVLNSVEIPVVSHLRCFPTYQDTLKLDSKFCAGGLREGGRDACQGDSGGPLAVHRNGTAVLAGVVSSGRGCAQPGIPAVYTRVSHFSNWLVETSGGDLAPDSFETFDDQDERDSITLLEDSAPISDTVYLGQIKMYSIEKSRSVEVTTLSGDADLFVYDEAGLDEGIPACISESFHEFDECEFESPSKMVTAVVFGFEDSSFTIEAKGAVLEPRNDDSPLVTEADEPIESDVTLPEEDLAEEDESGSPDPDDIELIAEDGSGFETEIDEEATVIEEADVTEIPSVEAPVSELPVENTPVDEEPVIDTPVADESVVATPVEDEPVVTTPVEDEPVVATPVEDEPVVATPLEDEPVVATPLEDEPVVANPVEEEPVVANPVEDESIVVSPVEEEPVVATPVVEEPVVNTPVAEEPVVNTPVAEAPVENTAVVVVLPPLPVQNDEPVVEDDSAASGDFLESEVNPEVPSNTVVPIAESTAAPAPNQTPVALSVPLETAGSGGGGSAGPAMLLFWLMFVFSRFLQRASSSLNTGKKYRRSVTGFHD